MRVAQGGAPAPPLGGSWRAVVRAAAGEATRHLTRARLWLLIALVACYGVAGAFAERDAVARGAGIRPSGVLGVAVGLQVMWLLALGFPLVAGGAFADDRASGHLAMRCSRRLAAWQAVGAYELAGLAVALVAAAVAGTPIMIVAWLAAPVARAGVGSAVSFAPGLLDQHPVAWMGLVLLVYALAASTLSALSILAGAIGWNRRIAEAGPPILTLVLGFGMLGRAAAFNPFERLSFLQVHGSAWVSPGQMFAYWGTAMLSVAAAAVVVTMRWDR